MTIRTDLRVPFMYAEFDPSRAFQGPAILRYKALIVGQRTSAGTVATQIPKRISQDDQGKLYFGAGSQLDVMIRGFRRKNKVTELWAIAIDDNGTTFAAGTITVTASSAAAGAFALYIAGKRIPISVAASVAQNTLATAIAAAINADTSLPVTASATTNVVTLTAKNAGTPGNNIDVRINYNDGEVLPSGITVAIVAMASGATDVSMQGTMDLIGDEWYHIIIAPYYDTTNLGIVETELNDRFGPERMIDGMYVTARPGTLSALTTFGNARNNAHVTVMNANKIPNTPWEMAASYGATLALEGQKDPAMPFTSRELTGILPPVPTDKFTLDENNQLLFDGISTFSIGDDGKVRVMRAITTYQRNDASAEDPSYLDVTTLLSLMYIRFDWRNYMASKYTPAKLADDGANLGPEAGVVMTPKLGRAEAIKKARDWERLGIVENVDQFIKDLVVARSDTDVNRMNFLLPPDLVNGFLVGATTFQFLLQTP